MAVGVILAGGRGERMGAGRNKALLDLAGEPMLLCSVRTLAGCCRRLMVVSAAADMEDIRALVPGIEVVLGGSTRQGSEWNAIDALQPAVAADEVVAIHDAARPLVAAADVAAVLREADKWGAAMLAAASTRTLLEASDEGGRPVVTRGWPPSEVWRAQTPQAARFPWLLDAYTRARAAGFDGTDTAAVLANSGYSVRVVMATAQNPKVTVPEDLAAAETLLRKRWS